MVRRRASSATARKGPIYRDHFWRRWHDNRDTSSKRPTQTRIEAGLMTRAETAMPTIAPSRSSEGGTKLTAREECCQRRGSSNHEQTRGRRVKQRHFISVARGSQPIDYNPAPNPVPNLLTLTLIFENHSFTFETTRLEEFLPTFALRPSPFALRHRHSKPLLLHLLNLHLRLHTLLLFLVLLPIFLDLSVHLRAPPNMGDGKVKLADDLFSSKPSDSKD
nr:uncharacterized protein LOC112786072 [Arachis hypogaea]